MNELMIDFGQAGYVYFTTNQNRCEKAMDEFLEGLGNAGINIDNLNLEYTKLTLRDADYSDIDSVTSANRNAGLIYPEEITGTLGRILDEVDLAPDLQAELEQLYQKAVKLL